MRHLTGYQIMALVIAALGWVFTLGGCGTEAPSQASQSSSPSLRTVAMFQSTDSDQAPHFRTSGPWVLGWTCNPYVDGVLAPYGLTIAIDTPDNYIVGDIVLDTECKEGNTQGTIGIRHSGEQWISVGTGGSKGPWTLTVQVAAGEQGVLLPTPTPTPTPPLPTPLPTPSPLPLMFTGNGYTVIGADNLFTTMAQWHFRATCTTSNGGRPYTITVRVWQVLPTSTNGLGDDTAPVGQDTDFSCDGQLTDSNQTNPDGFHAGTYSLQVVTGGDWKITVEKVQ